MYLSQTQPQLLQAPAVAPAATTPTVSTTIPDGSVVPAIAYDHGRSVLAVGNVDKNAFLRDAERVFTSLGIDCSGELDSEYVVRRHVLIRQRRDSVAILWRSPNTGDQVNERTPGAVLVTLIEI
jgi:hypothetical protein